MTSPQPLVSHRLSPRRALAITFAIGAAFAAIGVQLVTLGIRSASMPHIASLQTVINPEPRPDIVDRDGRILATDIDSHSLYVDPALVTDRNEVVEKLSAIFPDIKVAELTIALADRNRRFVWIKRSLGPRTAKQVHDLGLPGLAFRKEYRRVYPAGSLAAHALGTVDIDAKGVSGLEKLVDERTAASGAAKPLRTSLHLGVQHAVARELTTARNRYRAAASSAVMLDIATGEIVAAASMPEPDPSRPAEFLASEKMDRLTAGRYELGSIFKTVTIAMALERGDVNLDTRFDVRDPIRIGPHVIRDHHAADRPLTLREIYLRSSNVGAGMVALQSGATAQQAFLSSLGLLSPLKTETGVTATPQLPQSWGKIETVTISYGHGIALAPLQAAAAFATLINDGLKVTPTWLATALPPSSATRVVSSQTSRQIRELFRLNVTHASGTGRRAEATGYRVGGKTGTAELPIVGGYDKKAVIASFVAAFPMDAPRYLLLVSLFEPQPAPDTNGGVTAAVSAAPTASRIIARAAPLLGVLPRHAAPLAEETRTQDIADDITAAPAGFAPQLMFDAFDDAQ